MRMHRKRLYIALYALLLTVAAMAAPSSETAVAIADSLAWHLPKDSMEGKPYNKHFAPGEVLKGDPDLHLPLFTEDQNLFGRRRQRVVEPKKFHEELTLYFRRNKTDLDEGYLWNPAQTKLIRDFFKRDIRIDTVTIYAFASPEGHYEHNVWLSRQRAESARKFLLENSDIDPDLIRISQLEENWPGLRQAVRSFYEGGNRDEVMDILQTEDLTDSERKQRLIDLDGGKTYGFLIDTLMPPLRSAIFSIHWSRKDDLSLEPKEAPDMPAAKAVETPQAKKEETKKDELPPAPPEEEELWKKRTVVALKTNLLYDAATALNYQIEVPLGNRFSVVWEHYFPWWSTKKELKYCLQYLTLGTEARWWFAPRPKPETQNRVLRDVLVGHYIGVYGLWGKSDLQWQRSFGMYQCAPIWSAGLTYGYVVPIGKRLNLEFSISAGYARIPYQHYIPSDDWQILWRDRDNAGVLHYFGPTKATVTLSVPLLVKYKVKNRR